MPRWKRDKIIAEITLSSLLFSIRNAFWPCRIRNEHTATNRADFLVVDKQSRHVVLDFVDKRAEGLHYQRSAHDEKQIAAREIPFELLEETLRQLLAEEHHVRLHNALALAVRHFVRVVELI